MADTIAAIATALQPSAIGIIRLSGDNAISVAQKVFQSRRLLSQMQARSLHLGYLLDKQGRRLDQVLVTVSHAPDTYTGEDTAEFQCHGSPAVLAAGLQALFAAGARQAGPGEFTRRAFLNGRMDLTQAEAVIDLIEAQTADAAANAAAQVGGALTKKIQPLYDTLVDILSHFHAVLDYPDEDIEPFRMEAYKKDITRCRDTLDELARSYDRGQILRQGVCVAIVGSPNAGKSSLLNALAGYERVIVTDVAGTTRDSVEEVIRIGHIPVRLVDTAGIRTTTDAIEGMGVARAREAAARADLAVFVCDGSRPVTEEDKDAMAEAKKAANALAVINKSDLQTVVTAEELPFDTVLVLSAREGTGLTELEQAIEAICGGCPVCDGSILTNARQCGAARGAQESLSRTLQALEDGMTPDAVLTDVEDALERLGEITGRTMREEIVNRIFARFCVGK